jgi:hypothetical protein
MEMALSHQMGMISRGQQFSRQGMGIIVWYLRLAGTHPEHTGVPLILSGPKGSPGGNTGRDSGVAAAEPGPPGSDKIQIRSIDVSVPVGAEAVTAHLISHDKNYVRLFHNYTVSK